MKDIYFDTYKGNPVCKSRSDSAIILAGFFDIFNRIDNLEEDVLEEIQTVLNGKKEEVYIEADVVGVARVTYEKTYLDWSDIGYHPYTLETKDFEQIAKEWRDYLTIYKSS